MRRHLNSILLVLMGSVGVCSSAGAEILIGRMGSLTSPIAGPSTETAAQGFDLYVKKINDSGGINGQKLRVIFRDDEFKPPLVVERAQQLIKEDKVLALVLPQGTPGTLALIKSGLLKESGIAVVGAFTGDSQVLGSESVFPVRSSYEDEVTALARQMTVIGQKRVAYFYYNAAQGPLFAPVFERIVKAAGLEYVGAVGFDIDPSVDAQNQIIKAAAQKVTALRPDAVFTFAVGPSFPMAVRNLNAVAGRGVTLYTFSINNWETLVKTVGEDQARGVVFSQSVPYPYGGGRKIVAEYQADLKKSGQAMNPSFTGLEGYMTAKLLVAAISHAGPNPTRSSIFAGLEALGRYDLGDYVVNYTSFQHKVEPSVDITIIGTKGKLYK